MRKALLLILIFSVPLSAMTDAAALTKAREIWGPNARISKSKPIAGGTSTGFWYEVGCTIPNASGKSIFVAAGSGTSWDKAFTAADTTFKCEPFKSWGAVLNR